MKKAFLVFLFICVLLCGWIWQESRLFLNTPASEKEAEILFTVPPGASLAKISSSLQAEGLVSNARKFVILAWLRDKEDKIKAGRFLLNKNWLPDKILTALVEGKAALDRVTIPEGLTWWQTGKILAEQGFVRMEDFEEAIFDPKFLAHYGIPFSSAEGFLMPDTYLLKKGDGNLGPEEWKTQSRKVAGRLVDNFWQKSASIWPENEKQGKRPRADNLKKWVTLASIVEKETAIPSERPRVAGVYENRLQKNMLLQADPTVIYGMGPEFSGPLLRKHLDNKTNSYNTYQNAGLPPGPIASFGISALKAAVRPERHSYLYFVAKKDGGEHNFSTTLTEHNEAVREYRKQK